MRETAKRHYDEGRLRAYLDEALPQHEMGEIAAHTLSCEQCQDHLNSLRKGKAEISALLQTPVYTPDPQLALARLMGQVEVDVLQPAAPLDGNGALTEQVQIGVGPSKPTLSRSRGRVWRGTGLGMGLGLAAVLMLLLVLFSGLRSNQAPQNTLQVPASSATVTIGKGDNLPTPAPSQEPEEIYAAQQMVTKMAPELVLPDVRTGRMVALSSFRGKPVVLTFWDTKCPLCTAVLPTLREVADNRNAVQFIGVTFGPRDNADSVNAFLSKNNYYWLFLHATSSSTVPYSLLAMPVTYIIDASGTIRAAHVGTFLNAAKLQGMLDTDMQKESDPVAGYVAQVMVRHIVISDTVVSEPLGGTAPPTAHDIWFANGTDHLLMYAVTSGPPNDEETSGATIWIDASGVYVYHSAPDNKVYSYPYNPRYIALFGPNPGAVDEALKKLPNARITEHTTMNGRPVVKIENVYSGGDPRINQSYVDRILWLDSETGRQLKSQYISHPTSLGSSQAITNTIVVTQDELLDAQSLPDDFFKFNLPGDARLVNDTLDPMGDFHSDWYDFQWPDGNFAVLMPRTPDFSGNADGLTTIGAKSGGVTYGVKYRSYPDGVPAEGRSKEEALQAAYDLAISEGKVLSQHDITLDAYPGREYRLLDSSGAFRIWRIYLAKGRLYTVFAKAPNDQTDMANIERFFNSFRLLTP